MILYYQIRNCHDLTILVIVRCKNMYEQLATYYPDHTLVLIHTSFKTKYCFSWNRNIVQNKTTTKNGNVNLRLSATFMTVGTVHPFKFHRRWSVAEWPISSDYFHEVLSESLKKSTTSYIKKLHIIYHRKYIWNPVVDSKTGTTFSTK